MLIKAIYVQLIVLGLTLIWFVFSRRRSSYDLVFKISAIAILLTGLWLGSVWLYPPYWALGLLVILFAGISIHKWRSPVQDKTQASSMRRALLSNLPILILGPLGFYLGVYGFLGHRQNTNGLSIDLSSPFKSEHRVCVMSGGLNGLVNQHNFASHEPEDIGQTYGLDIIRIGAAGFRTEPKYRLNPKPKDYRAYRMFDTEIFAPCAGVVVWSENTQRDQAIGSANKDWTSGNGFTLACGNIHVKLAHMKEGSVLVSQGETVETGQFVGRIGNSGNTEEPHLHMHAETVVEIGNPWVHGAPVHMRFDGRLMARGDCF